MRDLTEYAVVEALRQTRVRVVAPHPTPGNMYRGVYASSKDGCLVQPLTCIYLPEYGEDWVSHPMAVLNRDVVVLVPAGPSVPIRSTALVVGTVFIKLSPDVGYRLLDKELTEFDLLKALDRGRT